MDICKRVEEIRSFTNDSFNEISKIKTNFKTNDYSKVLNQYIETLSLFSLIEFFAHEYANHGKNNAKNFQRFIRKFALNKSEYEILNEIDPITLFYHDEDLQKQGLNLDFLKRDGHEYTAEELLQLPESQEIISKANPKLKEKHRFFALLYKMRSITSRQFLYPTPNEDFHDETEIKYYPFKRLKPNGTENLWGLAIGNTYLTNLFKHAIENFLDFCQKTNRDPCANIIEYRHWWE